MATIFYDEMWMNDLGTKLQKHSSLPVRNDGEGRAGEGAPLPLAPLPRLHTSGFLGFL